MKIQNISRLRSPWTFLIVLLAFSAFFLFRGAKNDSAIFDETAHIGAGYSYVKYLDYRLNPEHPPLIKILAGVPLLFQSLNFPNTIPAWTTEINGQWEIGGKFLYEQGNDANQIIFLARIFPVLITLLTIFFIYFWSKELVGRWWALLPTFLFGFSPIVLTHGHFVTTDMGATFGALISLYTFGRALQSPTKKTIVWAGIAFGIAQLIKFSAILLIPVFLIIITVNYGKKIVQYWTPIAYDQKWKKYRTWCWEHCTVFFGAGIISLIVVYTGYLLFTWNYPVVKQVADTQATIGSFRVQPLAQLTIWMAGNPVLRPLAHYFFGVLMVAQRSAWGNSSYFLGELSGTGTWQYFPTVYAMKETLPTLMFLTLALFLSIGKIGWNLRSGIKTGARSFLNYLETHSTEFSFWVFIAVYWLASIRSPLNIGVRHILPTLPFIYMLATGALRRWCSVAPIIFTLNMSEKLLNTLRIIVTTSVKYGVIGILLIWFSAETISSAPYFLSYFNNAFGGTRYGYQYVTDSNFDWGQDLLRLQQWVHKNIPNEKIAVDYFGGGSPSYYLGKQVEPWWSARGNPKEKNIHWIAISVNTLQGALAKTKPNFIRKPEDEYSWLLSPYQPFDRAGTSIFIYKL
ncbi:MAG TPA: glycosyltransferase family 39 protein [Candidatus Paceibacterota bacterium]